MDDFEVTLDPVAGRLVTRDVRPPRHASYSSLDTYGNCPAQWAFGRLWRETPEWDDPLTVGSIAHAALELAVAAPEETEPSWLPLARRAIVMERERNLLPANRWKGDPIPAGVKAPNGRPATDEDWARLAANRLNGFRLTDVFDGEPLRPAAAEQRIDAEVWGIPMTGSVDYRDRSGRVVDWKTGRLPDLGSPKAESHQSQLRVYKALLDTQDIRVVDARDMYVEHRVHHMADLSDDAMAATGALMRSRWDGMRRDADAGSYAMRPSYLCPWCPLARVCPLASPARSDKARRAAARGIDPADPRLHVADGRPDGDPLAGMLPDACDGNGHKEDDMDLLDMLDAAPAAPRRPILPKPKPTPKGPDPWDTPAGREAAARWGLDGAPKETPKPKPDGSDDVDPWAMPAPKPEDGPKETPKAAPDPPADDPWGAAATPSSDAGLGVADGGEAPWDGGPTRRMARGRAYDPSVLTGGAVNSAGYGFTRLTVMAAEAYAIGPDDPEKTLLALIRAGWAASRAAWGANTPDVAGLKEGRPDAEALLRWLDSPLARDADEAVNRLMPADGDPADRIGRAGRAAARALIAARDLIR